MTFVRVQLKNGNKASLAKGYVDGLEDVEVLDEPATGTAGRPLPASRGDGRPKKPRTTVKKAAAKKAAARTTATSQADTHNDGGSSAGDA